MLDYVYANSNIMIEALGQWSHYKKGYRYLPKLKAVGGKQW